MQKIYQNIHNHKPRIHNITNYVTANDVANAIISFGGTPIMADDPIEIEEVQQHADALNINIGTLNPRRVEAMIRAGKVANILKHPVLLDLVGVGGSKFRKESVKKMLKEIHFTVIKGNLSEVKSIALDVQSNSGVDVSKEDLNSNMDDVVKMVKALSARLKSIIVVTGATDIVCDPNHCVLIHNGTSYMANITGSGCMLSGLITTAIACNHDHLVKAIVYTVGLYGISGEKASVNYEGNATFRTKLIDYLAFIDGNEVEKEIKYEIK